MASGNPLPEVPSSRFLAVFKYPDPAGHVLVTAYAMLRPDEQWSVMVVNKDQESPHTVRVVFHDDSAGSERFFTGPVSVNSFGSEQYHWHPDGDGGKADPDGPTLRSSITAGPDTTFSLAKASVTVLRGKVTTRSAPAKRSK